MFLVLGGAPDRPGAKAWAAQPVNLVTVAASRAKRRLYVIGDRAEWAKYNYFQQLSAVLLTTVPNTRRRSRRPCRRDPTGSRSTPSQGSSSAPTGWHAPRRATTPGRE